MIVLTCPECGTEVELQDDDEMYDLAELFALEHEHDGFAHLPRIYVVPSCGAPRRSQGRQ